MCNATTTRATKLPCPRAPAPHPTAALPRRHAIDDAYGALRALELGLENQRVVAITTARGAALADGREQPASMFAIAEKRRETSAGIEPRHAQPIDRAVFADQTGSVRIADQRVVLDS